MEYPNEKNSWMSVPQFGDWDQKHQLPDYSLDFSKIREMRKQNKKDFSRASIGNEEELIPNNHQQQQQQQQEPIHLPTQHHLPHSPTTRRTIFSYFNCCIKA